MPQLEIDDVVVITLDFILIFPTLPGFVLTNEQGVAELAVNGGGFVSLSLLRQPYGSRGHTLYVPANQLLDIGDLYMNELSARPPAEPFAPAEDCNGNAPKVLPMKLITFDSMQTPKLTFERLVDVQNEVSLVYRDFTRLLRLEWPGQTPRKWLNISTLGRQFGFEVGAGSDTSYDMVFDGRNVFGQPVYGLAAVDGECRINLQIVFQYFSVKLAWKNSKFHRFFGCYRVRILISALFFQFLSASPRKNVVNNFTGLTTASA